MKRMGRFYTCRHNNLGRERRRRLSSEPLYMECFARSQKPEATHNQGRSPVVENGRRDWTKKSSAEKEKMDKIESGLRG